MGLLGCEPRDGDYMILTIDGAHGWYKLEPEDVEAGDTLESAAARLVQHYGERVTIEVVYRDDSGEESRKRLIALCDSNSGDVDVTNDYKCEEDGHAEFLRETVLMRMRGELSREREMMVEGLPGFPGWDALKQLYCGE